jgi:hypothetical protein
MGITAIDTTLSGIAIVSNHHIIHTTDSLLEATRIEESKWITHFLSHHHFIRMTLDNSYTCAVFSTH